mgnify:CR=1 FL=1
MNNTRPSIRALLLSLLVLNTSCLFAGAMGDSDSFAIHNRFYFGGNLGAGDFINKEMHTVQPETHQLGSVNFIGGAFIGYDYEFMPRLHGAVEVFGDATGFNLAISHPPYIYTMKQRYDIGVRVLPAYFFNPDFSTHVILGYVNGGFKINDDGTYGFINQKYNQSGFQTGLGFTNNLGANFSYRVDGIYNIFGCQNSIGTTSSGQYQTYSNTFSSFIAELSLIYQFT